METREQRVKIKQILQKKLLTKYGKKKPLEVENYHLNKALVNNI